MALLSLYPQIDLWLTRGAEWQGSYASMCYDEEVYAAYINGLLLGRPRVSDALGIPDPKRPPYESLFSVQVVPAYLLTLLARGCGTISQAFIVLTPMMAFLTTLMLFYLLTWVTREEALAAIGALAVLIFGTLVARQSAAITWIWGEYAYSYFLFLRRYQPVVVFPIFFGFTVLTWRALAGQGRQAGRMAITAGAVFAVLIFSYFFLWTAAAAWLACLVVVWLAARSSEWLLLIKRLAPTVIFAAATLAVYVTLLSHRDLAMDKVVALTSTHKPDFYRGPEFVSVISILLLLWGIKQKRVAWREPVTLFASSLVLMPFAVFNQQIITGRSLQPIHYELYIANYVSLLGLLFTIALVWGKHGLQFTSRVPKLILAGFTCIVLAWGVAEARGATIAFSGSNAARDMVMPVTKRLTALAAEHGQSPNNRELVLSPDLIIVSANIAIAAPQAPFWSIHVPVAGGLSPEEKQERYFQYLYYCGVPPGTLSSELTNKKSMFASLLFGYERAAPELAAEAKPITAEEIAGKVSEYAHYIATFNRERAAHPALSYVVTVTKAPFDFSNLDRWYQRDAGERIGPFTLYQVKLR